MTQVIAVDLGATKLRAALIDEQGTIRSHSFTATRAQEGPQAVVERMLELIGQMRQAATEPIAGVGVGAPGPLDPTSGVVVTTPNMPGWEGLPLRALLEQGCGMPVMVGNDANVAALGEWLFGAGRGLNNVIYITVSTGIGGGIIVEGRPLLGRKGLAAEVGHMVIAVDGPRCGCGNLGCWEVLASGTALARQALEALEQSQQPSLLRQVAEHGVLSAADVARAAGQGDALAARLLAREGFYLGVGIVNLLHLFDPQVVVLGGGVTNIGEPIFAPIRQVIAERAIAGYRDTPVVQTQLGDEVGVLGAAALMFYAHAAHS